MGLDAGAQKIGGLVGKLFKKKHNDTGSVSTTTTVPIGVAQKGRSNSTEIITNPQGITTITSESNSKQSTDPKSTESILPINTETTPKITEKTRNLERSDSKDDRRKEIRKKERKDELTTDVPRLQGEERFCSYFFVIGLGKVPEKINPDQEPTGKRNK